MMKGKIFGAVVIAHVLLLSGPANAATLDVDFTGQLIGAFDVDINGTLYDVVFSELSCIAAFDGCDEASDFMFHSSGELVPVHNALLDQVLIDGPLGNFDSNPELTFGCNFAGFSCFVDIPYEVFNATLVRVGRPQNSPGVIPNQPLSFSLANRATPPGNTQVCGIWSLAAPVPLPGGLVLLLAPAFLLMRFRQHC